jgi:DNA-binding XRE family transcriptional regulator
MQVVVKKPHIRLEGEIGGSLVRFLRDQYREIEVIEDEDNELVEVTKNDWYQSIRETITPGENMRMYRQMYGMTQDQLAEKRRVTSIASTINQRGVSPMFRFTRTIVISNESGSDNEILLHDGNGGITHRSS